jgi:hypothetical protein
MTTPLRRRRGEQWALMSDTVDAGLDLRRFVPRAWPEQDLPAAGGYGLGRNGSAYQMAAEDIANPVINSPYLPPERHFTIGPTGPTGEVAEGAGGASRTSPCRRARRAARGQSKGSSTLT